MTNSIKTKKNKRNPEKTFFIYVIFYHLFTGIGDFFKSIAGD